MRLTNKQAEKKLAQIAYRASRLSYEANEIKNVFCLDGFAAREDHQFMCAVGKNILNVLEKELRKLERDAEKINKLFHKKPEIM